MTRRQSYFAKQKVIGFGMIIASIVLGLIFEDLLIIGVMTLPMGLILIFTKHLILVDSYFLDMQEEEEEL